MKELDDYLKEAAKSIFRFEYLQDFSGTDQADFVKWQHEELDIEEVGKGWWEFLEDLHRRGVVTQRVRRIVQPINDYTKFELEIHKETAKRGDRIKVIYDDFYQALNLNLQDFWLIDDTTVLKMNYDNTGKYLGFSIDDNSEEYVRAKDLLWKQSFPI